MHSSGKLDPKVHVFLYTVCKKPPSLTQNAQYLYIRIGLSKENFNSLLF